MKSIKCILVSITILFLSAITSCNKEDNNHDVDKPKKGLSFTLEEERLIAELHNGTPKLSEENAAQKALEAVGMINPLTKRGTTRFISSTRALTSTNAIQTKSRQASSLFDTLAYVFNFGNEDGFAIIVNDLRVP